MSWLELPGWFSFPRLYDEFLATAPQGATIVEVGVAYGRSLMYLAAKAIEMKRDDIRIIGVDAWGQSGARPEPSFEGRQFLFGDVIRGMLRHTPAELERVSLWRCTSLEASRALYDCHAVFIDGDHSYEAVKDDIAAWHGKTERLAGHDIDIDGVREAVRKQFGESGYRVWRDPDLDSRYQLDWEGGAGFMLRGQGPCWVRL